MGYLNTDNPKIPLNKCSGREGVRGNMPPHIMPMA